MKISLLAGAFLLFMVGCMGTSGGTIIQISNGYSAGDVEDMLAEIVGPTVQIRLPKGGSGSGVVFYQDSDKAFILTAYHVVDTDPVVEVWHHDQIEESVKVTAGKVVRIDKDHDIAVLITEPIWVHVAQIITTQQIARLKPMMPIIVYGHEEGRTDPHPTDGRIADLDDEGKMRFSASAWFGNSGCGAFIKFDGHWHLLSIMQLIAIDRGHIVPNVSLGCLPEEMISATEDPPTEPIKPEPFPEFSFPLPQGD